MHFEYSTYPNQHYRKLCSFDDKITFWFQLNVRFKFLYWYPKTLRCKCVFINFLLTSTCIVRLDIYFVTSPFTFLEIRFTVLNLPFTSLSLKSRLTVSITFECTLIVITLARPPGSVWFRYNASLILWEAIFFGTMLIAGATHIFSFIAFKIFGCGH